jgi:hypothetical protein
MKRGRYEGARRKREERRAKMVRSWRLPVVQSAKLLHRVSEEMRRESEAKDPIYFHGFGKLARAMLDAEYRVGQALLALPVK